MNDRTEIVIGANSKVAQEYLDFLDIKEIPSVAVYRTGDESSFSVYSNIKGIVKQDLRAGNWCYLENVLREVSNPRIVYMAAETRSSDEASFNDYLEVNALPVRRLVDIIGDRNIPLVYVSSDMVFGGKNEGFAEDSIPLEPFQKYGIIKRMGELYALESSYGKVLRLGKVAGTERDFPSSVVKTLRNGGNPMVRTNIYNKFTGINEACIVLNKIADYPGKQRVFHVAASDQPMSGCVFAEKIIFLLEDRSLLPQDSFKKLNRVEHDFKDNRPETLALKTEITARELGYKPFPIMCSILEKIDEKGSNYLRI